MPLIREPAPSLDQDAWGDALAVSSVSGVGGYAAASPWILGFPSVPKNETRGT